MRTLTLCSAEQQRGSDAHRRSLIPRPLVQSAAAPWHRPSASLVTSPERVRVSVLIKPRSTSRHALCSSSRTPRGPRPRGHVRVREEARAWQSQKQCFSSATSREWLLRTNLCGSESFQVRDISIRLSLARVVTSIISSPDTSSSASFNMDLSFATWSCAERGTKY